MGKVVNSSKLVAVLTGDLVNSSKLKATERRVLLEAINSFFDTYKVRTKNNLKLKVSFEMYRGDSFQCLIDQPKLALRMALLIRTYLQSRVTVGKKVLRSDARIAIGIGTANSMASTLAESEGEAFRLSGRLLDGLKKEPNQIAIKTRKPSIDKATTVDMILLEGIISKWTAAQAEVVYYKLQKLTEVVIAEILSIKQPAVNQRARSASWVAVETLLTYFEALP